MALAWLATALIFGIWAGTWAEMAWQVALFIAGVALCAGYFARAYHRMLPLLIAMVAFGLARAENPVPTKTRADLAFYSGANVTVHGVVDAEPDVRDKGSNYLIAANRILARGKTVPISGVLHIHTARTTQLEYGDLVDATGYLHLPSQTFRVSGRAIEGEMAFPRIANQGQGASGLRGWVFTIRREMEKGINLWLPEPEAALLIAITLGSRSAALGDLSPVLVTTGLIHVIAISGIKVALVAGTLYELIRRLGRRLPALLVSQASLFTYVLLTGATASGERSALMWSMVFLSVFLGRGTVALVSLMVVAASMLFVDPTLLWDTGFLMSTTGTLAIVAFATPLIRWCRLVPSPWREALCVSAAAQIGTLPVVAVGFHTVSLVSPLSNACVLPLLPALIAVGFLLAVASLLPALAAPISAFAYVLLHAFIAVAGWFAHWPREAIAMSFPLGWSVAYYAVLGGIALWALRAQGWVPPRQWSGHHREIALAAVCGLSTLSVSSVRSSHPSMRAHMTWLGSGQSVLLTAGTESVLIDGSPAPYALLEQLGRVLPPGERTIGLVVVTDPRASNVTGLESVLEHYRVGEVLDVGVQYPSVAYSLWRERLAAARIPIFALRPGASVQMPGISIRSLGPESLRGNARDSAGILRIVVQGRSYLFVGSSSPREQRDLLFRGLSMHSDVVVAAGGKPIDVQFMKQVGPSVLVSSTAQSHTQAILRVVSGATHSLDPAAVMRRSR